MVKTIKAFIVFAIISGLLFSVPSVSMAKFTCDVGSIKGNKLILKNCQEKGLKKLKAGDTVSITKKRKKAKAKVEGC